MIFPERVDVASDCAQALSDQQTITQPSTINEKIRLRIFRFPSCIAFTNECTRPSKGYRTGEQPHWLLALLSRERRREKNLQGQLVVSSGETTATCITSAPLRRAVRYCLRIVPESRTNRKAFRARGPLVGSDPHTPRILEASRISGVIEIPDKPCTRNLVFKSC